MSPTDSDIPRFHWADYVVFILTLLLSASIGIYYVIIDKYRKRNNTEDFLLAGRSMSVLPVSFSMFVSWVSAISFLADPVEVYYHGAVYVMIGVGYCLCVVPVAQYFAPKFHSLLLFSAYEYFEMRYSVNLKMVGSIIQGVSEALFCGIVLYAPALALAQVSGISVWVSTITVGLVCTFYTTLGGIKAVLWADTIQSFIMFFGLVTLLVHGCIEVGGWSRVVSIARARGRFNFNFEPNPYIRTTVWSYLIGGFFRLFNPYMYKQKFIQRYASLKTEKDVRIAVYMNIPLYALFVSLFTMTGLVMVAYFDGCDPLLSGKIEKPDQMLPLMVMEILGFAHGFPGLFLGSVFCAALSTMSSIQNSLAINLLKDVFEPIYYHKTGQRIQPNVEYRLSKIFSLLLGLVFISLALVVTSLEELSIFQLSMKITGCFSGPLAAMFVVGMLLPFVNTLGCIVGTLASLTISIWWNLGWALTEHPPTPTLPVHTDWCTNGTVNYTQQYHTSTVQLPTTTSVASTNHSAFTVTSLYALSPLYYHGLGFTITAVVAAGVGAISALCKNSREMTDEKEQVKEEEMKEFI